MKKNQVNMFRNAANVLSLYIKVLTIVPPTGSTFQYSIHKIYVLI